MTSGNEPCWSSSVDISTLRILSAMPAIILLTKDKRMLEVLTFQ